ncbi:MAG: EAL domain-containing protein, partial [Anaerovorax sp.]
IVFAIPIKATTLEGNNVLAIAASYELSNFDKNLSMTAFDGKGYAHIISKDGTIIIRSSSKNALPMGYNILTSISQGEMQSTRSVEDVQCQLEEEKSGQLEFSLGGVNEYMTYTPLGVEEWVLATFVPVSVVNAKSTLLLESTILLCSFITISFGLLLGFLMVLFYRHKRKLEKIAYVDPVTDGNTIQRFYDLAAIALQDAEECEYALVYTNIKKFKVLNEQFGRSACDATLRSIENAIAIDLKSPECVGHLFADNFCVLIKYGGEEEMTERFRRWHQLSSQITEKNGALWLPLILEFGVYIIDDNKVLFPHMIDRAKLALSETTVEILGKLRYAIYDERVRRLLLREKQLEDMMEEALENCEFEVYLQPKYHTKDEKIGGAEALVRWNSQTEGMIYPDEFISLFEKNGFIVPLDFWVFEQTCKALRRWIDAGFEPVKISVNCSRIHLKNPQFLDQYCIIAEKCNVSPEYLEIELTENTVFEDVEHLTHTIERIHQAGFGCSMDDFGSGYSSLNLIQDIPVDTLKLDRIFFRDGVKNEIRTESVIASIISMAKALAMKTVAEGVERREQVDMLKRLDCDYIQGYYFAKPMPIGEFEALAFGVSLDHQLPLRRTEEDS